jgi:HEAT repeat protein
MATDLDFLLLQLNSTKPQEKKKAVAAIEKNACVEAAPALVNILAADRDDSLRACAAKALGALNYAPAGKSLLSAMESGSDEVCYFASHALAAINSDGCAVEIFRAMKDEDGLSEKAFYWYAHTLVKMGGDSLSYLVSLLETPSWTKRRIIGDLLSAAGENAEVFLINGLGEGNSDRRFWCANILGKLGGKDAVDALVNFVDDENDDIRTAVITSLGEIGSKQAIEVLKKSLKSPKKETRHKSIEVLGRFGEEIIESLIESLSDDYWYVRDCACRALAKLGKKVVPHLAKAYRSGNEDIRISAIKALYETGIDSLEVLITALSDNYEPICKKAADALAKIGKPVLDRLIEIYKSGAGTVQVRKWIIYIMGEVAGGGSEKAVREIIMDALDSRELTMRYGAVCALKNFRDPRTIEKLIGLMADIHEEIREKSVENLLYMAASSMELLVKSLNHENWVVRKNAAYVLGKFGSRAISELMKVLESGNENSRYWAIKALGQIGVEASGPLLKSLDDPDWQVRKNSADSLSEIGSEVAKPLVNQLIKAIPQANSNLFYWSRYVLINIGSESIPLIARLLQTDSADLKLLAVGALGRFTKKREAYQLIKDAVHDENGEVAKKAVECLGAFNESETVEILLNIAEKTSEDDELALALVNSLSKLESEPALAYLYRMLKSAKWVVRQKTMSAFYNLSEKFRERVESEKIIAVLSDDVPAVASLAAGFLASLKSEKAQIAVVRLLKEKKFVREILASLSRNPDFKSKDLVFSYVRDGDKKIRAGAASVIGLIGSKADAAGLTVLLSDDYAVVRMAALHAINMINSRHSETPRTAFGPSAGGSVSASVPPVGEVAGEASQFYQAGLYYAKNGETEKAVMAYQKAIAADPGFVEAYCKIGLLLEEKGYYEKAAAFLKKAIEISPDFALAHLYLGIVLSMTGRNFDAVGELKKVIKLEAGSEMADTAKKIIEKIRKTIT